MALIPAIIHGIHAYKKEKERLAGKAEGDARGGGKLNFGQAISFDESEALTNSFNELGMGLLEQAGQLKPPTVRRPQMTLPTYEPGKVK
jgi:hypothetical protein